MPRVKINEPEPNPGEATTPDLFGDLIPAEQLTAELKEQEAIIEATQGDFIKCGTALSTIRDKELFRATDDESFMTYMKRRWTSIEDMRRIVVVELRQLGQSTRQIAEQVGVSDTTVVRDLQNIAADPTASSAKQLPTVIVGKDNKQRSATAPQSTRTPQAVNKPAPQGKPSHPARFSEDILAVIAELLNGYPRVLDPFAGIGGIHILADQGWETVGIELEPRWASQNPRNKTGNALDLSEYPSGSFDAVATSPTYGNRLADNYQASDPQARHSYTFDYGADLNPDNTGRHQWGDKYRALHQQAWGEAVRVIRPGGRFVLNIKDHIRNGEWQDVAAWHMNELFELGLDIAAVRMVGTGGRPSGANAEVRAPAELIIAFDKPAAETNGGDS